MKATYDKSRTTKWTTSHRKEGKVNFHGYKIVTAEPGETNPRNRMMTRVDLRIYNTQGTSYACLWVRGCDTDTQGSGRAGGYGYHRSSAAVDEAIRNAGFTLDESIAGVGGPAIQSALCAIADCLNLGNYGLIECNP